MATINFSVFEIQTRGDRAHLITWASLGNNDVGQALGMVGSTKRTVQLVGTFAGGSKVTIEGSNDGVNYSFLTDEHGNKLEFKGNGISTVSELTAWIRPAATGDPAATVTMLLRKTEAR
jgi:hypothetical protein